MSKRHHKKHKKSRTTSRPVVSAKLLFLAGIGIMVVSFGWYYIQDPARFDFLKREVVASLPKTSSSENIPRVHEKPHFEFYNILPNTAVEVSSNEKPAATEKPEHPPAATVASIDLTKSNPEKPEVTTVAKESSNKVPVIEAVPVPNPAKTPAPAATVASKKGEYVLQVGAFPKFADADRLKAKLTMDGFSVKVNPVDTPKGKWFRVNIGPFASADTAEQQRQRLARAHYNSIIRKTV